MENLQPSNPVKQSHSAKKQHSTLKNIGSLVQNTGHDNRIKTKMIDCTQINQSGSNIEQNDSTEMPQIYLKGISSLMQNSKQSNQTIIKATKENSS